MRHKTNIILGVLSGLLMTGLAGYAWDGRWTNGASGQYPLPDVEKPSKSSQGDSGLEKDRPQHYFMPPTPLYEDIDPDEISDNTGHNISPYAMVRLTQDLPLYGKQKIPKGYYLVKIGHWGDGSARQKKLLSESGMTAPVVQDNTTPMSEQKENRKQEQSEEEPYNILLFKQNGKVLGIVPIDSRESLALSRKEMKKLPKTPMAWVESDPNAPHQPGVLKFYYRHTLYIAHLGHA